MKDPIDKLIHLWNEYDLNQGKAQMRKHLLEAKIAVEFQRQRMFMAGFKSSAEGYNGEYPFEGESEAKIWDSIKEDYDKVNYNNLNYITEEDINKAAWKFNPRPSLDVEFIREGFREGARWAIEQMNNK